MPARDVGDRYGLRQIMKIQCDVCGKEEAALFCTADEAALCAGCDHRVHHANKLASKHQRFSLLSPSAKDFPVCDVCKEKRAFLFCQQDRAILCRECDVPIHTANEHTRKHNRFLLTGVKLSATSALYTAPTSAGFDTVPDFQVNSSSVKNSPVSVSASTPHETTSSMSPPAIIPKEVNGNNPASTNHMTVSTTTSSISEYLIETLPGWHFEDFLDSCSASFGFCKTGSIDHDGILQSQDNNDKTGDSHGIWVPQAPTPVSFAVTNVPQFSAAIGGLKEAALIASENDENYRWSDDIFAVPQISPPTIGSKRSRHQFY